MNKFSFLSKTALRDSRKNRGKLLMFMSSIVLGITALVAINSFNYNLQKDIDKQAASLLGADLVTSGNRPIGPKSAATIDSLPGESASQLELFSMAFFPKVDETKFVSIKALEGNFPFYGKLSTIPLDAQEKYIEQNGALVDQTLMLEYGLKAGDSIKLGDAKFAITGELINAFGSNGIGSTFAPSVYIRKNGLDNTDLVRPGSLVNYTYYQKLPIDFDADAFKKSKRDAFRVESMRIETVEDRKENLSEAFDSLNYFLNLVAMVSLLLGCIGVASSVFIYVKSKISTIAVFRCLGMSGKDAFLIYFLQIFGLGLIGVVFGAILGTLIQVSIPLILSDFLPFKVSSGISWRAISEGIGIGSIITILFALFPLIGIRKVSPLRTLRSSVDQETKTRDPLKWLVGFLIILSIFGFLWILTQRIMVALSFTLGLALGFGVLFAMASLIMYLIKKFFPRKWSFVFRQGLSNLFRPNNQTQTLIVSIGLGTAVLTTLFIIQGLLLNNVAGMDAGNQPNMILYGIERTQADQLQKITASYDMPIIQQVPIVTMRLEEWKGRTKEEWMTDTTRNVRGWAANREARVTYRDSLDSSEELVEGNFIGTYKEAEDDSIFISLGDSYARGLDVEIGDELVWNVQGARITTYVSSLRKIKFDQMTARFFILFPTGVLEDAPQFRVLVTKSPDNLTTINYRKEVVKAFPNVSVVDLGSILAAVSSILDKVSYIIKFMAIFSILTGLIVLLSSLLLSKYQRIKESVLLRTLGANKNQILSINAIEYALIGALAAAAGIFLSIISSYLLATFQLDLDFNIQWLPILAVFLLVTLMTMFIGMFNSRDVIRKAPLEVLRKEV